MTISFYALFSVAFDLAGQALQFRYLCEAARLRECQRQYDTDTVPHLLFTIHISVPVRDGQRFAH